MKKPLVEARNILKTFGPRVLLDDLSFQISEGEKIALIGRNGAGKTTLLKILLGEEEMDSGELLIHGRTQIGVVRQNEVLPLDKTVEAYLEEVSEQPVWEVRKMGARFGLFEEEMQKAPGELSGGYQMRVKLAALFLQGPNMLYLDEPVNYLDLQTLLMLEDVLKDYRGAFLLVAHDRTFLEKTCGEVYEIERGTLTTYNGGVEDYLAWKKEQLEFAKKTNKKLAKEIQHHQKFVDRFGSKASLASRAQNKVKHIKKLRSKITEIQADLATVTMKIPQPDKIHGGLAVALRDISVGYEGHVVVKDVRAEIQRGDKVVIVGENGQGKSTLVKTLVGKIAPIAGDVKWWKHANVGYYDQLTSKSLSQSDTVLQHLQRSAPADISGEQILMVAGNFLFRGDDLDKSVSMLSGGERARLALAGVLLKRHSILILDEPTNHMDVETTEQLARALQAYTGTIIFISHARTFVQALATRIFEIQDGVMKEFIGNYEEYVQEIVERMDADLAADETRNSGCGKGSKKIAEGKETEAEKQARKQLRKELQTEIRRNQKEMQKLDDVMSQADKEKNKILAFFFENPTDYAPEKYQRLQELDAELEKAEEAWMKAAERIEVLREEMH